MIIQRSRKNPFVLVCIKRRFSGFQRAEPFGEGLGAEPPHPPYPSERDYMQSSLFLIFFLKEKTNHRKLVEML